MSRSPIGYFEVDFCDGKTRTIRLDGVALHDIEGQLKRPVMQVIASLEKLEMTFDDLATILSAALRSGANGPNAKEGDPLRTIKTKDVLPLITLGRFMYYMESMIKGLKMGMQGDDDDLFKTEDGKEGPKENPFNAQTGESDGENFSLNRQKQV